MIELSNHRIVAPSKTNFALGRLGVELGERLSQVFDTLPIDRSPPDRLRSPTKPIDHREMYGSSAKKRDFWVYILSLIQCFHTYRRMHLHFCDLFFTKNGTSDSADRTHSSVPCTPSHGLAILPGAYGDRDILEFGAVADWRADMAAPHGTD